MFKAIFHTTFHNFFWFRIYFNFADARENPYGEDDSKSPFPVMPRNKRSYAQNITVWIKASGVQVMYHHWMASRFKKHIVERLDLFFSFSLQTDVQKILRNARKLPEKTQTFYKVGGITRHFLYSFVGSLKCGWAWACTQHGSRFRQPTTTVHGFQQQCGLLCVSSRIRFSSFSSLFYVIQFL